jgi:hypothetical protein
VVVTEPAQGAGVRQCELLLGTAKLSAVQTLVFAMQNVSTDEANLNFQPIWSQTRTGELVTFKSAQYFGAADDSVGQKYTVKVFVVDAAVAKKSKADSVARGEDWYSTSPPDGAVLATTLSYRRVAGAGPAGGQWSLWAETPHSEAAGRDPQTEDQGR